MPVISLLTDFGLSDPYVGIMKGVILSKTPGVQLVDISHGVAPQNLIQAAFLIESAYGFFPENTVHVVVVDPGVGSGRRIVALSGDGYFFLAPDNGVLTRVLKRATVTSAVAVENRTLFLANVSRTFHGRDVFAPVAAFLSRAGNINELGPSVDPMSLVRLPISDPEILENGGLIGTVVDIDRFGNLITDIDESLLGVFGAEGLLFICVSIGGREIHGLKAAYADAARGEGLSLIGSRGTLEISVNCGNAADFFSAAIGDRVKILPGETR